MIVHSCHNVSRLVGFVGHFINTSSCDKGGRGGGITELPLNWIISFMIKKIAEIVTFNNI